ncbi:alpha/beta fold hydrolase [Actinomadura sp. LD22]|uniref:Alpha/beta fold hydrolase n=2 Tax=Actinomadura physcomitrii TaxID=2650748 RepID=A0A6I4MGN3_9ACTN|nr:alpha/beta fold hydrolase [Actinomadura physcomitrii]
MFRMLKKTVVAAVCCAVAGGGLAGCDDDNGAFHNGLLAGTRKINVAGYSVNVSCTGDAAEGKPVIFLMPGLGDGMDKMAALQKTLSEKNWVCVYDRLGEGKSDKPKGPQSIADSGKVLTAVLARVTAGRPVVLAGHSLGGLIAARYAPDHRDMVKGLVLMDATTPDSVADVTKGIPASATGPAAQLRAQTLAVDAGNNPEKLAIADGKVRSAGDIPVEVIQHGKKYLAAVPVYGPRLERDWAAGQHKWLAISSRSRLSTAANSQHYIYVDQPAIAVQAIQRVAAQVK